MNSTIKEKEVKRSNYMKTAKEIVVSTLKEEIPFLTEAKYDIIAIRLVKELGLTDAKILSINEIKENGYGTSSSDRQ